MNNSERCLFHNKIIPGLLTSIIVTFNQGDYLLEAIDSVLDQDYEGIEIIVSDDGTKDFDVKRIEKYISEHQKGNIVNTIVLTRKNNVGTVRNINNALSLASGEFIKLLGGDDTYPQSHVFSLQVDDISLNKSLVSIGKAQQCDYRMRPIVDERVEKSNRALPAVIKMNYCDARKYITKNDIFPIAIQAVCYHRDFFELYGTCDEDYYLIDDSPAVLKILSHLDKATYVDSFTVNHRSKVGISSSREMFAPRRLLYYQDCVTYAKKEIYTHPEIYTPIYRKESVRINSYVYKMAKAKKERKPLLLPLLSLIYTDAIIYYTLTRPRKLLNRLIERLRE